MGNINRTQVVASFLDARLLPMTFYPTQDPVSFHIHVMPVKHALYVTPTKIPFLAYVTTFYPDPTCPPDLITPCSALWPLILWGKTHLNFTTSRYLLDPLKEVDIELREQSRDVVVVMLLDALDEACDGNSGFEAVAALVSKEGGGYGCACTLRDKYWLGSTLSAGLQGIRISSHEKKGVQKISVDRNA
eukprot:1156579-Pelagomonas_calceolata.AAC.5